MKKRAVLSLSGGMDSTSLLIHLLADGYEVRCYSFDYNQKHSLELERVLMNIMYLRNEKKLPVTHRIINLASVFDESESALTSNTEVPTGHYAQESMKATVIENRNAIFSSIIYGKALSWANKVEDEVEICLGIHSGDHAIYPDCRPEFRDSLNHAFKIGNWGSEYVDFYTPYLKTDKTGILKDLANACVELDCDFYRILANTNTCYNPSEDGCACSLCGSCIERIEAFMNIDRVDPIKYQHSWAEVTVNARKILSK